ncbi:MAG: ion transporter [Bacteroidota bacterium]|nr:ion transporter [Bacteroidota bacterium]
MREEKSKWMTFKQKVHIIIYGVNTFYGKLFDVILLGLIFLSVLLVMLESVKSLDAKYHSFLHISEWVITIFFTIEYILRIISKKKPWSYIFSFYGIIDFISVLPMYLSFFIPGSQVLSVVRALRLLRLFRVLNLVQFTGQESHLKLAIKASRSKITVFVYFVIIVSCLLGSLMYVVEKGDNGFYSIPDSIYWVIVTLTTVGYGDITPVTTLGKIISSLIMVMGYGIIAVPTGIVAAEYSSVSQDKGKQLKDRKCRRCGKSDHSIKSSFCYNCGKELEHG